MAFVARTSSSPSGSPCAPLVSCFVGAPYAMCESTITSVGRSLSRRNVSNARESISRSFASPMRTTFHPWPMKRVATPSLNVSEVFPSIVMWLLSYTQHRFDSFRCPASDAASAEIPSIRHPSPAIA